MNYDDIYKAIESEFGALFSNYDIRTGHYSSLQEHMLQKTNKQLNLMYVSLNEVYPVSRYADGTPQIYNLDLTLYIVSEETLEEVMSIFKTLITTDIRYTDAIFGNLRIYADGIKAVGDDIADFYEIYLKAV